MSQWQIGSSRPLQGIVPAPPDREAASLALIAAAIAEGESVLQGRGLPPLEVAGALAELGVVVERIPPAEGGGYRVHGRGLYGLRAPEKPLECGESAASMAALAGVLAGQPFASSLTGDQAVVRRVMDRVARPIRLRGGQIEGRLDPSRPGELAPPIDISPSPADVLSPLQYQVAPGDWHGKTAALFSGLYAAGATSVHELLVTHDLAERTLVAAGVPLLAAGSHLHLPEERPAPRHLAGLLPGDPELTLALLACAAAVPGSTVGVRRAPTSSARSGWLEALRDAGCPMNHAAQADSLGHSAGDIVLAGAPTRGLRVGGERAARLGVGPALMAALAALGEAGATGEIFDVDGDLDVVCSLLQAFGVTSERLAHGIVVTAPAAIRPAEVDAAGDRDRTLAAVLLGLRAGHAVIRGAAPIELRAPRFVPTLRALGAEVAIVP